MNIRRWWFCSIQFLFTHRSVDFLLCQWKLLALLLIFFCFIMRIVFRRCITGIFLNWTIINFSVSSLLNFFSFLICQLFWVLQNQLGILFRLSFFDIEVDIKTLCLQNIQMLCWHILVSKIRWLSQKINYLNRTLFWSQWFIFISDYRFLIIINCLLLYVSFDKRFNIF